MIEIAFNVLVIAIGLYLGARNLRLMRNETLLDSYVRTSPRMANLVTKYGHERATQMLKTSLPFRVVIALVLVGLSVWNLLRIAQ